MTAALLITLRETLEAALIVGIALAYLKKTANGKHAKYIWYGVLGGIVLSVLLAIIFQSFLGGFEGKAEEIYEGVMMLTAAGLLTWMILWMLVQRRNIKKNLEDKMEAHLKRDHYIGLMFITFVGVAREGIETVIFLQAAFLQSDSSGVLSGGVLGMVIAIILAYILFKGVAKVPLRKFFTFTSVLLILFAAGLVAHGVHEFQEAGVVPIVKEHVWDLNPEVVEEGVYPVMHESGAVGGILKGLFGYNGNPNLLEVLSYLAYLIVIALAWWRIDSGARKFQDNPA